MNDREARREHLVGQFLPYFLSKMTSFAPGQDSEIRARSDAFALAERVMRDSDDRAEQETRDRLGRGRSER